MKKNLVLIAMLGALAAPAIASPFDTGDSYGPRSPNGDTAGHASDAARAQIKAQLAAGRAAYGAIAEAGGCEADFLPTTVATYCWKKPGANPTGGPVGASEGGGD